MPKFIPKWYGEVDALGKLHLIDRKQFDLYLQGLKGSAIELTLKKKHAQRSLDANAYLWVIYTMVADYTGFTPEEIHGICKTMFLKKTKEFNGNVYEVVGSTAILSTQEFSQYIEKVKVWATQEFSLTIPDAQNVSI